MNNRLLSILSKLFKSWIILVSVISVLGWLTTSVIVLHDYYIAQKVLAETSHAIPWKDGGFKSIYEVEDYLNSFAQSEDEKLFSIVKNDIDKSGLSVREYSGKYHLSHGGRWGDSDMSELSFLWITSLWLVIGLLIVVISLALRKWTTWLFRGS